MDARAKRNNNACECEWGESASAVEMGSLQVWNWKPPKRCWPNHGLRRPRLGLRLRQVEAVGGVLEVAHELCS
ncbi:hypothetical protein GUJ93_ZPchr0011g27725 [Zizania palustris]|uniref:Uncharacterized protein n=1 Tax=Zizania palustris TaxID=103762 RepID=A0A8J6BJW4_ZIZPA|nr:hypothetical protein GUJ93_ZPchr0011g27725 [Zizania palustris]